jgi:hypothetical protein
MYRTYLCKCRRRQGRRRRRRSPLFFRAGMLIWREHAAGVVGLAAMKLQSKSPLTHSWSLRCVRRAIFEDLRSLVPSWILGICRNLLEAANIKLLVSPCVLSFVRLSSTSLLQLVVDCTHSVHSWSCFISLDPHHWRMGLALLGNQPSPFVRDWRQRGRKMNHPSKRIGPMSAPLTTVVTLVVLALLVEADVSTTKFQVHVRR